MTDSLFWLMYFLGWFLVGALAVPITEAFAKMKLFFFPTNNKHKRKGLNR